MELERRKPMPKEFKIKVLRKTDNRLFFETAVDLPWTVILPRPTGTSGGINFMEVDVDINTGDRGTIVNVKKSPSKRHIIRFMPDMIEFEKRVEVKVSGKRVFYNFVTPESSAIVDELRSTGDRTRLPLATMEF
jgi:hypothetical protein